LEIGGVIEAEASGFAEVFVGFNDAFDQGSLGGILLRELGEFFGGGFVVFVFGGDEEALEFGDIDIRGGDGALGGLLGAFGMGEGFDEIIGVGHGAREFFSFGESGFAGGMGVGKFDEKVMPGCAEGCEFGDGGITVGSGGTGDGGEDFTLAQGGLAEIFEGGVEFFAGIAGFGVSEGHLDLDAFVADDAPDEVFLLEGIDAEFEDVDDALGEVGGIAGAFILAEIEFVEEGGAALEVNAVAEAEHVDGADGESDGDEDDGEAPEE